MPVAPCTNGRARTTQLMYICRAQAGLGLFFAQAPLTAGSTWMVREKKAFPAGRAGVARMWLAQRTAYHQCVKADTHGRSFPPNGACYPRCNNPAAAPCRPNRPPSLNKVTGMQCCMIEHMAHPPTVS